MKKIAIIGASYLQEPLIQKAKTRGIETHVFAWAVGDIGEKSADYFYPISITEKDAILKKCQEIGIDGICSIASDLAVCTVCYVAEKMGLTGNSVLSATMSTNKHNMRIQFEKNGDPSPHSIQVNGYDDAAGLDLTYPVIVKPIDRSGSRGITKVNSKAELEQAINRAIGLGFEKKALVEEFAAGYEYSVEYVSWKGQHTFLAMTQKYTTGAPNFIETGHLEPAPVSDEILASAKAVVEHALNSLGIEYGASHSEIKIDELGNIKIIEIGARMGGDCIGSSLVELSTGYDFVSAVIDIALGIEPKYVRENAGYSSIRFIFSQEDINCYEQLKAEHPECIVEADIHEITADSVTDSGSRFGYFLMKGPRDIIEKYMPDR